MTIHFFLFILFSIEFHMSCPKLMEKLCSQLEIFDFFSDILYKIMRSKVYEICCFRIKNTSLVSEVAKTSYFSFICDY